MNIKKMLEAQKELDAALFQKGGLKEYPMEQIKTAYRVELGEALQEWKAFKYWKKNKGIIDINKLLEEIADCLHFALSLEGEIKNCNFSICIPPLIICYHICYHLSIVFVIFL